jgi:hypothetical protein
VNYVNRRPRPLGRALPQVLVHPRQEGDEVFGIGYTLLGASVVLQSTQDSVPNGGTQAGVFARPAQLWKEVL